MDLALAFSTFFTSRLFILSVEGWVGLALLAGWVSGALLRDAPSGPTRAAVAALLALGLLAQVVACHRLFRQVPELADHALPAALAVGNGVPLAVLAALGALLVALVRIVGIGLPR